MNKDEIDTSCECLELVEVCPEHSFEDTMKSQAYRPYDITVVSVPQYTSHGSRTIRV